MQQTVGTYQEPLPCGGTLTVLKDSWFIQYYWTGPTRRHSGTFHRIPGETVPDVIDALKRNWETYLALRQTVPAGGEFTASGEMGMTIRIGGFAEGVCLRNYHLPIATDVQLADLIKGYEYAALRACHAKRMLQAMEAPPQPAQ